MCLRRTLFRSAPIAVIVFICLVIATQATNPRVNTTSGEVEGLVKTVTVDNQNVDVNVFLGIPYAEPPTGDRRFRVTVEKKKAEGILNATDYGPVCPQNMSALNKVRSFYPPSAFVVNEDCLVLNIYAPSNVSDGDEKPTMVWIHGGAYTIGTANIYDGSLLAAYGDVVVVAINYRLGALGYLAVNKTGSVLGNYGAFDQKMALLWVVNNIKNFGGSSSNITLFGASAGASSASLLTLFDTTNILFKRVIAECGTALTNWALAKDPLQKAKTFASYANCPTASEELLDCLRSRSVDDIIKYQTKMDLVRDIFGGINFGPVVDGTLFQFNPQALVAGNVSFSTKRFAEIDHLIGTNSQEGAFIYDIDMAPYRQKLHFNDSVVGLPESVFRDMLNKSAHEISPEHFKHLLPVLEYRYTDPRYPDDGMLRARFFIQVLTDRSFYAGIVPMAQFHARVVNSSESEATGNTFFYEFDHRGSWETHEPWRFGADHGDEVSFVFGLPLMMPNSLPEEKQLSITMMKLWSQFAKTGDPNLPSSPEAWPKYQIGEEKYLVLRDGEDPYKYIYDHFAASRVTFWNDFVPKFLASFTPAEACPIVKIDKCTNTATAIVSYSMFATIFISVFTALI